MKARAWIFLPVIAFVGCASNVRTTSNAIAIPSERVECHRSNLSLEDSKQEAHVSRVVDGDTLKLSNGETVRLVGVDTPETVHPKKMVQFFGKEASTFTKQNLTDQDVVLIFDQNNAHTKHRDKYGRTLAYIFRLSDGLDFNAELIRQGYAHSYLKYPSERGEEFLCLEREARSARRGLWGNIIQ